MWRTVVICICVVVCFSFYIGLSDEKRQPAMLSNQEKMSYSRNASNSITFKPWPNDTHCKRYDTGFGVDIPPVWLFSYPRSGNTWIRYLIESATGIFSGSVYSDKIIDKLGYLGEAENFTKGTVLTIKSHQTCIDRWPGVKNNDYPAIFIVRNPRDSIKSFFAWNEASKTENKHTAKAKEGVYQTDDFHKFVNQQLITWEKTIMCGLIESKSSHLVIYEDFIQNPRQGLEDILNFLNFPVEEGRFECVLKYLEGPVHRKDKQRAPYTEEEESRFRKAIERVSVALKLIGKVELPFN